MQTEILCLQALYHIQEEIKIIETKRKEAVSKGQSLLFLG